MYLAREKNNDLYLFYNKPHRGRECWWAEEGVDGTYLKIEKKLYPEVTWESEPVEAILSLKPDKT